MVFVEKQPHEEARQTGAEAMKMTLGQDGSWRLLTLSGLAGIIVAAMPSVSTGQVDA
ncbi:uncharacterized protein METZ01_LOCUS417178, partial [marine metagenome]